MPDRAGGAGYQYAGVGGDLAARLAQAGLTPQGIVDHHRLAKRAKDIGSAAVLLALINVMAVWGLVLFG